MAHGEPGDEGDIVFLGVSQHFLAALVGDVVEVFHRDDVGDHAGLGELVHGDFGLPGQPDVMDLALFLEPGEFADLVVERHGRIDAVELVEVDALKPEVAQAHLDLLAQVLGAAEGDDVGLAAAAADPVLGTGAQHSALGGDDHVLGVGVQGAADDLLVGVGAVGVGGVDEGDAEVDGAAQHADGLLGVGRRAPEAGAGQVHRAVAEAVHGQVFAEGEGWRLAPKDLHRGVPPCLLLNGFRRSESEMADAGDLRTRGRSQSTTAVC